MTLPTLSDQNHVHKMEFDLLLSLSLSLVLSISIPNPMIQWCYHGLYCIIQWNFSFWTSPEGKQAFVSLPAAAMGQNEHAPAVLIRASRSGPGKGPGYHTPWCHQSHPLLSFVNWGSLFPNFLILFVY